MYIQPGHMVLLLGGSGAGKTTFINAVNGYEPANAEIMINGNLGKALMNIKALSKELLADGSMVAPYALIDGIVVSGK